MKIVTIVGARPQFIKAATVSRALKAEEIKEVIIHTGQHFDLNMSDVFFQEMDIPKPDYFLNINGLSHGAMTGQMLEKIEAVLVKESPEAVLVYGDTNSTLAGALAASKLHIPVAHVEAGLRSFNARMPEEINRILTDRVSQILFCPTKVAMDNLNNEGFKTFNCSIHLTGDVMYDAALHYSKLASETDTLSKLGLKQNEFYLCTFHRQENTDDLVNLQGIIAALNEIHQRHTVVVPLHPRTRKNISQHNIRTAFTIIDPVGYFDMINLIKGSRAVMTDSGGLQKEAYFFKKYCVTMREQTEWRELVETGNNELTGADTTKIIEAVERIATNKSLANEALYGHGDAAVKIVQHLVNQLAM